VRNHRPARSPVPHTTRSCTPGGKEFRPRSSASNRVLTGVLSDVLSRRVAGRDGRRETSSTPPVIIGYYPRCDRPPPLLSRAVRMRCPGHVLRPTAVEHSGCGRRRNALVHPRRIPSLAVSSARLAGIAASASSIAPDSSARLLFTCVRRSSSRFQLPLRRRVVSSPVRFRGVAAAAGHRVVERAKRRKRNRRSVRP